MGLHVTKRNASTQPIAGTAFVNEVVDALDGKQNPTGGVGSDIAGPVDNIPVRVESTLSGDGLYAITIGEWKKDVPEAGTVTATDLFDFDTRGIPAVGIVVSEVISADGTRNYQAADVTFGWLQAGHSDKKSPVVQLGSARGIIDLRYSTSTHAIEVTFDGSTWIPKVVFAACSADVTVTG